MSLPRRSIIASVSLTFTFLGFSMARGAGVETFDDHLRGEVKRVFGELVRATATPRGIIKLKDEVSEDEVELLARQAPEVFVRLDLRPTGEAWPFRRHARSVELTATSVEEALSRIDEILGRGGELFGFTVRLAWDVTIDGVDVRLTQGSSVDGQMFFSAAYYDIWFPGGPVGRHRERNRFVQLFLHPTGEIEQAIIYQAYKPGLFQETRAWESTYRPRR